MSKKTAATAKPAEPVVESKGAEQPPVTDAAAQSAVTGENPAPVEAASTEAVQADAAASDAAVEHVEVVAVAAVPAAVVVADLAGDAEPGAESNAAQPKGEASALPNADDLLAAHEAGEYSSKLFVITNNTSTPHLFPSVSGKTFVPGHRIEVEIGSPHHLQALCIDIDAVCGMEGAHKTLYTIEPVADAAGDE